jgi:hypothetical protein
MRPSTTIPLASVVVTSETMTRDNNTSNNNDQPPPSATATLVLTSSNNNNNNTAIIENSPLIVHSVVVKRLPNTSLFQVVEADEPTSLGHIIDISLFDKVGIPTPKIYRSLQDANKKLYGRPAHPLTCTYSIQPGKGEGTHLIYEVVDISNASPTSLSTEETKTVAQFHQVQTSKRGEIDHYEFTTTVNVGNILTFSTKDKSKFEVSEGIPLIQQEYLSRTSPVRECGRCGWYLLCCPISVPIVMCAESKDPFFDGDGRRIRFSDHVTLPIALSSAFFLSVPPRFATRPLTCPECCCRSILTILYCNRCSQSIQNAGCCLGLRNDHSPLTWSEYWDSLFCYGKEQRPGNNGNNSNDEMCCLGSALCCVGCMSFA